jgi:3-hydroxyisobutyrate dehydrogenase-like beta-hydroxyacid dehydrogenase
MAVRTVGILTPGDMGHSVGEVLRHGGLRVITCLQGRSPRTAALAAEAGIVDVPDYETLVREADMILSILAPSAATAIAERVAVATRATGANLCFVECNAIAPQTVRRIGETLTAAGARFVDAGIIGGPPKPGRSRGTRFYASGEQAGEFAELSQYGLEIRLLGDEIGKASGIKMCYAALTKGLTALGTELLMAAKAMGVEEALRIEQSDGLGPVRQHIERTLPGTPPKAYRYVGEMEEIAATFEGLGLTPHILLGAADFYRFMSETPLGQESPEVARKRDRTADEALAELAAALPEQAPSPAAG